MISSTFQLLFALRNQLLMESFARHAYSMHKSKYSDNLNPIVLTQCSPHIDRSQLIFLAKYLVDDIYMRVTLVFNGILY